MEIFLEKVFSCLSDNTKLINNNYYGINLLEQIKYLLIDNIKDFDKSEIEKTIESDKEDKNYKKKFEFNDNSLLFSINCYKESFSRIKYIYPDDTLSLVIVGQKEVNLFNFSEKNKNDLLYISKNNGLILSHNTTVSEVIKSGSIILDIFAIKKNLNDNS